MNRKEKEELIETFNNKLNNLFEEVLKLEDKINAMHGDGIIIMHMKKCLENDESTFEITDELIDYIVKKVIESRQFFTDKITQYEEEFKKEIRNSLEKSPATKQESVH